jgi:hypothetical protein
MRGIAKASVALQPAMRVYEGKQGFFRQNHILNSTPL